MRSFGVSVDTSPSWAAEIIDLVDAGHHAQADRLLRVLLGCRPDAATEGRLRLARAQLQPLLGDSPAVGRWWMSARAALRATLSERAMFADDADAAGAVSAPGSVPGPGQCGPAALEVRTLGALEVRVRGARVTRWESGRARALLRVLVLRRSQPVPVGRLTDLLWPAATPGAARNSLHVAVHALRRTLAATEPAGARGGPVEFVIRHDGGYQLSPEVQTWVDVEQFDTHRTLGDAARRGGDAAQAEAHFRAAALLYRGALFEDDAADWHLESQQAIEESCADLLESLAELQLDRGDTGSATRTCRRLLRLDPCREGAHRLLMHAHLADGDHARALRQYHRCLDVLRTDLGVGPEPRTTALFEDIKIRLRTSCDAATARADQTPRQGPRRGRRSEAGTSTRRTGRPMDDGKGKAMPQANDAEITAVYTAAIGLDVEDNEPNTAAPGQLPATVFAVHLEAVAGNVIGNGGGNYVLEITCIDETLGAPNNAMKIGPINQQFLQANGWQQGGIAGNFFNEQVFQINVPPNVRGHVFRYVATLVSAGSDIVSFMESNRFVLV